jgi:cation diffusion facilitator CzcD-associated flavoprotein CzcO
MEPKYTPAVIVGAGPAGLATAGRLRKLGVDFEVLEQTDKIASTWHNHYDRLCLHTVKQLSNLPHKDFPDNYPLYVPREDLVQYYEDYAADFDIKPHFNQQVNDVKRQDNGQWQVSTAAGLSFLTDHVIIATGVNRVPHSPTWEGQDSYKGQLTHSISYKNADPFQGHKVLIIGFGNTGAELALDLSENDVDVTVSIRTPITIVPRDVNGRPVQVTAKQLAKLPFGLGDWLGTQIRRFIIGDLTKYGVPLSKIHPAVQLRETGKTPVIDLGTVAHIKSGKIKVVGDIDRFCEEGVILENGEKRAFDSIILATGYRANLHDFVENVDSLLDKYKVPKEAVAEGRHEGLYFVGFDNYKLGGLLGTIFTDSETVAETIKAKTTADVS